MLAFTITIGWGWMWVIGLILIILALISLAKGSLPDNGPGSDWANGLRIVAWPALGLWAIVVVLKGLFF